MKICATIPQAAAPPRAAAPPQAAALSQAAALAVAAALAWLGAPPALSAQAATPSALSPCAFTLAEIDNALGVQLHRAEAADMTIAVGRDVGCLYSLPGSDFVFGVRQTWDSTRAPIAPHGAAAPGYTLIAGDPDGAIYTADAGGGSSGELVYVRGKVQTRVFWHGGNLTAADGLQRLLRLRRVP